MRPLFPRSYYVFTPDTLIVSLNEAVIRRSIDRAIARQQAAAEGKTIPPAGDPWLAQHVNLRVKRPALELLQGFYEEQLRAMLEHGAWSNIPILNEWHRRYPQMDPVEFHQRFWQTKLLCPGGGGYVWNEEFQTMESTVFGHPGHPRSPQAPVQLAPDIMNADLGLTFENDDGVRAQALLLRERK